MRRRCSLIGLLREFEICGGPCFLSYLRADRRFGCPKTVPAGLPIGPNLSVCLCVSFFFCRALLDQVDGAEQCKYAKKSVKKRLLQCSFWTELGHFFASPLLTSPDINLFRLVCLAWGATCPAGSFYRWQNRQTFYPLVTVVRLAQVMPSLESASLPSHLLLIVPVPTCCTGRGGGWFRTLTRTGRGGGWFRTLTRTGAAAADSVHWHAQGAAAADSVHWHAQGAAAADSVHWHAQGAAAADSVHWHAQGAAAADSVHWHAQGAAAADSVCRPRPFPPSSCHGPRVGRPKRILICSPLDLITGPERNSPILARCFIQDLPRSTTRMLPSIMEKEARPLARQESSGCGACRVSTNGLQRAGHTNPSYGRC